MKKYAIFFMSILVLITAFTSCTTTSGADSTTLPETTADSASVTESGGTENVFAENEDTVSAEETTVSQEEESTFTVG